ncbi:Ubiquitin C-terminal hydrolase [Phaffia rhodozyma]|uniref:ubiquitinyl hydrolase 1 n=1 Tax=Phaffia rhodozyma TaxID=264483 RepID=A0A0F7SMK6_PHARH|nr:Ubiquitin C-terminal hydrolase [Phaffia rhodozyma]
MTAPSPGYYLGIVNMSGTFCFLNSVLQALSSLTPFLEHLSALSDLAIRTDTPTPLLSTFLPVLFQLLTPSPTKYPRPLRPTELVEALRQSDTVKRSGMFGRLRDQQDAQELWVLLNGCVEEERVAIEKNDKSSKLGIKGLLDGRGGGDDTERESRDRPWQSPFEGRMAFRRSCQMCGYSEGIRLTKFDSLSLPVPRARSTTLESMLEAYTSLEILTDSQCRKCRVLHTLRRLRARLPENEREVSEQAGQIKTKSMLASTNSYIPLEDILRSNTVMNDQGEEEEEGKEGNRPMTNSKKKRLREARKELERERELIRQIEILVSENRWEDNLDGVAWDLVDGGISTRQDMLSLPPRILTLHLNRSSFDYHYASKNACQVIYPAKLDLTPFSTTGTLSLSPSSPISSCAPSEPVGLLSGPLSYELSSAVYHYGSHTSGHYVTYRRVPFTDRWLRISDDDVAELPNGVADVRRAAGEAFMLFYELREGNAGSKQQACQPELSGQPQTGRSSVSSFNILSDRDPSPMTNGHVAVDDDAKIEVTCSTGYLSEKPKKEQEEEKRVDDREHDRGSTEQDRSSSKPTDDRKKKRKKKKDQGGTVTENL